MRAHGLRRAIGEGDRKAIPAKEVHKGLASARVNAQLKKKKKKKKKNSPL
eukprot:NODE_3304_length_803_cov_581.395722.p9 GENE.NODE_3304_length_803_cov_581.395722~~NODE_3304_length_803_cov_581.395722.p9  ORF type:complete len:50 (-),score=32.20 NODE_3304_length_803_cov_581.395722:51-200(-)